MNEKKASDVRTQHQGKGEDKGHVTLDGCTTWMKVRTPCRWPSRPQLAKDITVVAKPSIMHRHYNTLRALR